MKKRFWAALLALAMVVALLPATAKSDLADPIYVGGVALQSGEYLADGETTPTTVKPAGGYAYYENGTLTLNNAVITTAKSVDYIYDGATGIQYPDMRGVYADRDLTLDLVGSNTITGLEAERATSYCIYVFGNLTVRDGDPGDGVGSLNATACSKDTQFGSIGIFATGSISVYGGNVTATGQNAGTNSYGVYAHGGITVTGGTVTAVGNTQAVNMQPNFGTSPANTWYMWKENTATTEPAVYTSSSNSAQFTNYTTAKYLKVTPSIFTTQPQSTTVTEGSTSGAPTVAAASGATYLWHMCTDANKTNDVEISGATSATCPLRADFPAGTYCYFCRVSLNGQSADSRVVTVTVNPARVPATGDGAMPLLWAGLVLLASIGLAASVMRRRKSGAAAK